MESRKKLKMPRGNVHDISYLYNIIYGLKSKGGCMKSNSKTYLYLKKIINNYNDARASKYGFSFKPREVNVKIIEHLLAELEYLKLIRKEEEHMVLTNQGEYVASLIEKRDSRKLKEVFTKMMLENFSIFEKFLKKIKMVSNGEGVPIPLITSYVFDKCGMDFKKIAEKYVDIINKHCPPLKLVPEKLHKQIENSNIHLLRKRTDKINKLQSIIEKFVVFEAFGPDIKSRRVYDFVRSRSTFLELTNYGNFDFEGFPAEVTYMISDFAPIFDQARELHYSGGTIYINYPSFEKIQSSFKDSIMTFWHANKDNFGYVKVPDLRDAVCRRLKISDNLFDEYIKRLYKEEPHWLIFTYGGAGDKITEKRLPIILEKPMREFFTLLKLKERS